MTAFVLTISPVWITIALRGADGNGYKHDQAG